MTLFEFNLIFLLGAFLAVYHVWKWREYKQNDRHIAAMENMDSQYLDDNPEVDG